MLLMNLNKEVTVNEIEIAIREAYSLRDDNSTGMKEVYRREKNGRISIFYKDSEGNYWFKTKYRKNGEIVSEEEYIFGRKIKKERRYKRPCY